MHRRRGRSRIGVVLAGLVLVAAAGGRPAAGQVDEDGGATGGGTDAPIETAETTPEGATTEAAATEPATPDGATTRVIVALEVDVAPEADLDQGEVADQRAEIEAAQDEVAQVLEGTASEVVRTYETLSGFVAEVDPEGLAALEDDPRVAQITEDVPEPATLASSVPVVDAPEAWAAGYDGEGGTVAVLDSGVATAHPALADRIVTEACFSSTSGNLTSSCGNGGPTQLGAGSGQPCTDTGCDHGTHVAATVSSGTAGVSGAGVAPGAGLAAIKVFGNNSAGSTASFPSDQEAALEWLLVNREALDLVAVNMSLGAGSYSSQASCDASNPTRAEAVANLRAAGVAVVISSGNSGLTSSMGRPGCFSAAVSVGATTDGDTVASFSNSADFLSLLAPGVNVCAAVPSGFGGDGACGTNTDVKSGTSMAAPHVAGAFALLHQQAATLGESTAVDDLLAQLQDEGVPVTDTRGGAGNRVTPRIDLDDALLDLAVVSGTLTETGTSDPVADGWALLIDPAGGGLRGATTAADGSWSLVTPTDQRGLILLDPSGEHAGEWFDDHQLEDQSEADLLDVGLAGATADADLDPAGRTAALTGAVTETGSGDPLEGIRVISLPVTTFQPDGGAITAADGTFTIEGLSGGDHLIVYLDPSAAHGIAFQGGATDIHAVTLTPLLPGATATADSQLAPAPPPATDATVVGTVTEDGTGDPLAGAFLLAIGPGGPVGGTTTDASGQYSLPVPSGTIYLEAVDPTGHHAVEWFDDQPIADRDSATPLTPGPGDTVVADFALAPAGPTAAIAGTVTEAGTGDPLSAAWVAAITSEGRVVAGAVTDGDGDYTIDGLDGGAYYLAFIDPGGGHAFTYLGDTTALADSDQVNATPGATATADAALEPA